jgi:hypothetical protein
MMMMMMMIMMMMIIVVVVAVVVVTVVKRYFSLAKFDTVLTNNSIVIPIDSTVAPTESLLHTAANLWFFSY